MAQLNPYLNFTENKCREAMAFYKECLGGELILQTVESMPEMAAMMPPEFKNHILHATLISGGITLMASDLTRETPVEGNTYSLCINCDTEEELNKLFAGFSEGGKVIEPVKNMPWGAKYGELKDKFGKVWLFNFQIDGDCVQD